MSCSEVKDFTVHLIVLTANFKSKKGYNSININTRIIPFVIHVHIASGNIWQVLFESLGFLSFSSKVKIVHDADDVADDDADDDDDDDDKGITIARTRHFYTKPNRWQVPLMLLIRSGLYYNLKCYFLQSELIIQVQPFGILADQVMCKVLKLHSHRLTVLTYFEFFVSELADLCINAFNSVI